MIYHNYAQNLSMPQISDKKTPPRNVSVTWDKKMQKNLDTHFIQIIFDTSTILKHREVHLRIFLILWDKEFSTENQDIPRLRLDFFDARN